MIKLRVRVFEEFQSESKIWNESFISKDYDGIFKVGNVLRKDILENK